MTDPNVQLTATFAFTTYVGELLTSPQPTISQQESELLALALPAVGLGDWKVVWGPMLYRFPVTISHLYDNFMFVAQKDDQYMIAIRGTNGHAPLDWVFEDFWVIPQQPWAKVVDNDPPPGLDPKISHATHTGLQKLLGTPIVGKLPGSGSHLEDFLRNELASSGPVTVTVTGHSLGGALAPTLALYLADTQGKPEGWDPTSKATVESYAFAGPTAGNGDFARHTEQKMGTRSQRVVNPLDIVPLSWSHDGMERMKNVYDHIDNPVHLDLVEKLAIDAVIEVMKVGGFDYEQYHAQPGPGLVTLNEIKDYKAPSFMAQAGWQHVQGYENQLGIADLRGKLDALFTAWCKKQPPGTCPAGTGGTPKPPAKSLWHRITGAVKGLFGSGR